jgi:FkbM family methyltransferase
MRLRCEVAIPSGFRQGRVFIRLRQPDPDLMILLPCRGGAEATHQLVGACGLPLLTHLAEQDSIISGELTRSGMWEFTESMNLLSLARPGGTFVDAGANVGYYSVVLANALGPAGQVYAFEPEPRNSLLLCANALLTRQTSPQAAPIETFRLALTDQPGEARLNLFERNLGLHSLVHAGGAGACTVPTETLDSLRWPQSPPAPLPRHIDLLKADVQGGELALLRGAEQTIERDRPVLCLEFEPEFSGPEGCASIVGWLSQRRYEWFRLFHANVSDPYQALAASVRLLSADEVLDQLRLGLVGPYGTLVAFPAEGAAPPSSDPPGPSTVVVEV